MIGVQQGYYQLKHFKWEANQVKEKTYLWWARYRPQRQKEFL